MYKRSLHVGDPVEGGVSIPSKNYEDQKSTKTSGLTSSNKLNQSKVQGQTQSSLKTVGRQTSNPKTTTKIWLRNVLKEHFILFLFYYLSLLIAKNYLSIVIIFLFYHDLQYF